MADQVPTSVQAEVRSHDSEMAGINGEIGQLNSKLDHLDGKLGHVKATGPAQLMPQPPHSGAVDFESQQYVWVAARKSELINTWP